MFHQDGCALISNQTLIWFDLAEDERFVLAFAVHYQTICGFCPQLHQLLLHPHYLMAHLGQFQSLLLPNSAQYQQLLPFAFFTIDSAHHFEALEVELISTSSSTDQHPSILINNHCLPLQEDSLPNSYNVSTIGLHQLGFLVVHSQQKSQLALPVVSPGKQFPTIEDYQYRVPLEEDVLYGLLSSQEEGDSTDAGRLHLHEVDLCFVIQKRAAVLAGKYVVEDIAIESQVQCFDLIPGHPQQTPAVLIPAHDPALPRAAVHNSPAVQLHFCSPFPTIAPDLQPHIITQSLDLPLLQDEAGQQQHHQKAHAQLVEGRVAQSEVAGQQHDRNYQEDRVEQYHQQQSQALAAFGDGPLRRRSHVEDQQEGRKQHQHQQHAQEHSRCRQSQRQEDQHEQRVRQYQEGDESAHIAIPAFQSDCLIDVFDCESSLALVEFELIEHVPPHLGVEGQWGADVACLIGGSALVAELEAADAGHVETSAVAFHHVAATPASFEQFDVLQADYHVRKTCALVLQLVAERTVNRGT